MTAPRWLLLASDGTVVGACHAPDRTAATGLLKPRAAQTVVSEASYRLGLPKPLAPHLCRACGVRAIVRSGNDDTRRCGPCQRLADAASTAASKVKRPVRRAHHTSAGLQAIREANILRGVAQAKARRGAG